MNKLSQICLVILVLGITGCASAPKLPTRIEGNTVFNQSTGFSGWRITFPPGYNHFTPSNGSASNGQIAWHLAQSIDKFVGWTALEHIVYEGEYGAIAMTTTANSMGTFNRSQVDWLAGRLAQGFVFPPESIEVDRKVLVINGRSVAKISRKLESRNAYNSVYRVPFPPRHSIDFNGYSTFDNRHKLDADIEAAIVSLSGN